MKKNIINYNGSLIPGDELIIPVSNRLLRYGDGLFESIRIIDGNVFNWDKHNLRLLAGAHFLKIQTEGIGNREELKSQIEKTYSANDLIGDARVRLTIFREGDGFYTPESNLSGFIIEVDSIEGEGFSFNEEGLITDVFDELLKPHNSLSNIKSCNAIYSVMASVFKKENGLDDCFILNESGRIAEASSSNVFIMKDGELHTPPLSEACVAGTMRESIIEIAKSSNIVINESVIPLENLLYAEEVFLTNAISGIHWIREYKGNKYGNKLSNCLFEKLAQKSGKKL